MGISARLLCEATELTNTHQRGFDKTLLQRGALRSSVCLYHNHYTSPSLLPRYLSSFNDSTEMEDMTGWTVQQTLNRSLTFLQESEAPEPESSVTHLLAGALHLPWSNGFVLLRELMQSTNEHCNYDLSKRTLTLEEAALFRNYLVRRVHKEPLQYILGKWDFLDYTFRIRPPLLCPRPETEELVLLVEKDIQQQFSNESTIHILDVGCGTGVIGVSLAAMIPNAQVTAIDMEPIAVETSNENAHFILGDCEWNRYQAIRCPAKEFSNDGIPLDVIVSNPPYIPTRDMRTLSDDVINYESEHALCGGKDGMDVIRDIVYRAPEWSRPGSMIWMEVDPTHPKMIQEWLEQSSQDVGVAFESAHQDLYGRDRFVKLKVL